MEQVYPNVWVGSDADYDEFITDYPDGAVIHAAKEPWHRKFVGYTGRGAPKDSPEYLAAERGNELALNLVDCPKPEFIPRECFEKAAEFFEAVVIEEDRPILIHCNQGHSRGPAVAMYCLARLSTEFTDDGLNIGFEDALERMDEIYSEGELGEGVLGAMMEWWDEL